MVERCGVAFNVQVYIISRLIGTAEQTNSLLNVPQLREKANTKKTLVIRRSF
jgi:hypothetical protein